MKGRRKRKIPTRIFPPGDDSDEEGFVTYLEDILFSTKRDTSGKRDLKKAVGHPFSYRFRHNEDVVQLLKQIKKKISRINDPRRCEPIQITDISPDSSSEDSSEEENTIESSSEEEESEEEDTLLKEFTGNKTRLSDLKSIDTSSKKQTFCGSWRSPPVPVFTVSSCMSGYRIALHNIILKSVNNYADYVRPQDGGECYLCSGGPNNNVGICRSMFHLLLDGKATHCSGQHGRFIYNNDCYSISTEEEYNRVLSVLPPSPIHLMDRSRIEVDYESGGVKVLFVRETKWKKWIEEFENVEFKKWRVGNSVPKAILPVLGKIIVKTKIMKINPDGRRGMIQRERKDRERGRRMVQTGVVYRPEEVVGDLD